MISGPVLISDNAEYLCVLLHGYGADGDNLIDLGHFLNRYFPQISFFAPNAPYECEVGFGGYQWGSLASREENILLQQLDNAKNILEEYIDFLVQKYCIDYSKVIVLGFSQGCYLALHTALQREKSFGMVIGFSGGMIGTNFLQTKITAKPQICLIHCHNDEVVPFSQYLSAKEFLQTNNFNFKFLELNNVGHSISISGLEFAKSCLQSYIEN